MSAMWHDVIDLRDFYAGETGQVARHILRRSIRSIWPDVSGLRVMGLGYASPYLRQFRDEAERVFAFMPAGQGVLHWPAEEPGLTALIDENTLPLANFSVDRGLLVHAMEHATQLPDLLQEIWRVLMGDGRLIVVVPNRRGIWARSERTPFGWGRPFSASQLSRVLRDNAFAPVRTESALFVPPTRSRALLRSGPAWERIGMRWCPRFSGLTIIEANKRLYAPTAVSQTSNSRKNVVVPFPQVAGRTSLGNSVGFGTLASRDEAEPT